MEKSTTRLRAEQLYAILQSEVQEDTGLWVGILQDVLGRVDHLPKGSYSMLVKRLEETGCISTLSQGRFKHIPTTLKLNHAPNDETWFSSPGMQLRQEINARKRKTSPSELARRVETLETLVGGIPMPEVLTNLTNRLESLSARLRAIEEDSPPKA